MNLALIAFAWSCSAAALICGKQFPQWAGLTLVGLFLGLTIFFIGPTNNAESAIASGQELPLIALYLGWFLRPVVGRILMTVVVVIVAVVVASNPVFHAGGELGVTTAVQMFIVMSFCFEVGSLLWRESRRKVQTDLLTGALNRDGFLERLDRELVSVARSGAPMCLVVLDFDYFKRLNDTQGHAAGDAALADTVRYLKGQLRANDVVGRTGGDEFAIMLGRSDATATQQVMKRVREGSPFAWSWGIAQARVTDNAESLFERADNQLYRQKRRRDALA
ncbi:MAG: GGDEF domain-containing protein [Microbacteriaceae bacterium]|nr:GGDEF domain-containing protein [Microbacteriaceae bacterium]